MPTPTDTLLAALHPPDGMAEDEYPGYLRALLDLSAPAPPSAPAAPGRETAKKDYGGWVCIRPGDKADDDEIDLSWEAVKSRSKKNQKWVGTGEDAGKQNRYLPRGQDPNKKRPRGRKPGTVAKPQGKLLYSGVVLDDASRQGLLKALAGRIPAGWKVVAHHMTTAFGKPLAQGLAGKKGNLTATHVGYDEALGVLAVRVESDIPSENATPHITVAVGPHGKPQNSNRITSWEPLPQPVPLSGTAQDVHAEEKAPWPVPPGVPPELEAAYGPAAYDVRDAVMALGGESVRIRITDLRKRLGHLSHDEQDRILTAMDKAGILSLYQLDDPREIRPEDRDAAIRTRAGTSRHILYFGGRASSAYIPLLSERPDGKPIPREKKPRKVGGMAGVAEGARQEAARLRAAGDEARATHLERLAYLWEKGEGTTTPTSPPPAPATPDQPASPKPKSRYRVQDDTPHGASLRMNSFLAAYIDQDVLKQYLEPGEDMLHGVGWHNKRTVFPIEGKFYVVDFGKDGARHTQELREVPVAEVDFRQKARTTAPASGAPGGKKPTTPKPRPAARPQELPADPAELDSLFDGMTAENASQVADEAITLVKRAAAQMSFQGFSTFLQRAGLGGFGQTKAELIQRAQGLIAQRTARRQRSRV